jgi:hypothetical protein
LAILGSMMVGCGGEKEANPKIQGSGNTNLKPPPPPGGGSGKPE